MNRALESEGPLGRNHQLHGTGAPRILYLPSNPVEAHVLYETDLFWCVYICGQKMSEQFLKLLYSSRESSYKAHLKGNHVSVAFDPKDKSYTHVLVIRKPDGNILAGMRLMPSAPLGGQAAPTDSYLEHSFPGFYRAFSQKAPFLELSRLFFAVEQNAKGNLFMAIYRGVRLFAQSISCNIATGLTSYNHFAHDPLSNSYFLNCLRNPKFFETTNVPAPRYPLDLDLTLNSELEDRAHLEGRIAGVERSIQKLGESTFRVSPITRIYLTFFKAKVIGFSMGKSYNGLTELLMYSDFSMHPGKNLPLCEWLR